MSLGRGDKQFLDAKKMFGIRHFAGNVSVSSLYTSSLLRGAVRPVGLIKRARGGEHLESCLTACCVQTLPVNSGCFCLSGTKVYICICMTTLFVRVQLFFFFPVQVTYDAEKFIEKNADSLHRDIVKILSESKNSLAAELFRQGSADPAESRRLGRRNPSLSAQFKKQVGTEAFKKHVHGGHLRSAELGIM